MCLMEEHGMVKEERGMVKEERRALLGKKAVLYLFPASMESMKAHIALRECAFPRFSIEVVDVFSGIYSPTFARLQPSCKVPLLVMPDGRSFRNALEVVSFVHRNFPMYPDGIDEEDPDSIKEFCDLVQSWDELHFSLGNPYANSRRGLIEASVVRRIRLDVLKSNLRKYALSDPVLTDTYRRAVKRLERDDHQWESRVKLAFRSSEVLEEILDRAEELLATSQFLFGKNWTAADSLLTPVLQRIAELGHGQRIKRRLNLARYFSMVSGRPSYQKAIAPYGHSWIREHYYGKLVLALLVRALPYILILVVFALIVVMALHDQFHHLAIGGHPPAVLNGEGGPTLTGPPLEEPLQGLVGEV